MRWVHLFDIRPGQIFGLFYLCPYSAEGIAAGRLVFGIARLPKISEKCLIFREECPNRRLFVARN